MSSKPENPIPKQAQNNAPPKKKIIYDYTGDRGNYDMGNINEYKKTNFNSQKSHNANKSNDSNWRYVSGQQSDNSNYQQKFNRKENDSIQNSKSVDSMQKHVYQTGDRNNRSKSMKTSESIDQMPNRKPSNQNYRDRNNKKYYSNPKKYSETNSNTSDSQHQVYKPPHKREPTVQTAAETEWRPTSI